MRRWWRESGATSGVNEAVLPETTTQKTDSSKGRERSALLASMPDGPVAEARRPPGRGFVGVERGRPLSGVLLAHNLI